MASSEENSQSASYTAVLNDNQGIAGPYMELTDEIKRKLAEIDYLNAWYLHFCDSMQKFVQEKKLGRPGDDIFDNFLDYIRSLPIVHSLPVVRLSRPRIGYFERSQGGMTAIDLNQIVMVSVTTGDFLEGCRVYFRGDSNPVYLVTPLQDMVKFWEG